MFLSIIIPNIIPSKHAEPIKIYVKWVGKNLIFEARFDYLSIE